MTEKEKHNIDKLFEQGLKNHEEKAPLNAWDMLDASLDKKHRIRVMRAVRYAAASVLIVLAFFVGREFGGLNQNQETPIAQKEDASDRNGSATIISPQLVAEIVSPENVNPAKEVHQQNTSASNIPTSPVLAKKKKANKDIFSVASLSSFDISHIHHQLSELFEAPEKYQQKVPSNNVEQLAASAYPPEKSADPEKNQWELGGFFSPVYSYRTTENQSFGLFDNSYKSNTNGPGSFEQGQINFSAGITAEYALNKKWSVESGLFYARMGQSKNGLVFENKPNSQGSIDLSTSAGKIDGSKLPAEIGYQFAQAAPEQEEEEYITNGKKDTELHQQFDFVEIPILFKYRVYHDEVGIHLISGITTGIMVNNSSIVEIRGQKSNLGSTKNLRKFLYSSVIGFGMQYEVTKGLYINMEPTFKYALHSMNPSEEYKYKPYSLGINTGVSFGF